ncbi:hypothetical protein GCM10011610_26480 [Nocardia rhizosphaerihabitans]|uniref:Uncharacterized protein n=1 Tax=Nocardia rhizosphaerihabitans TaxID=1691570 RepID=A0ABQ2KBM9_9NOCA|nr:hypothetical protein GCM10011610_26480 [Nocardia rhizosphaerihabitans]
MEEPISRFSSKKKSVAETLSSVPSGAIPTKHAVPVGRRRLSAVAAVRGRTDRLERVVHTVTQLMVR